jgi:hypothetical protein
MVAKCLEAVVDKATNPQSETYCFNICASRYLEEAFAIANEFQFLHSENKITQSNTICFGAQDGHHPAPSEVLTCLQQHSSRYREKYQQAFACTPET